MSLWSPDDEDNEEEYYCTPTDRMDEIRHFSHPHILKFGNGGLLEYSCVQCKRKGRESGPFYSCFDCRYQLHKSCADVPLPQEILEHPFHPGHRLTLVDRPIERCNSCYKFRIMENKKYFHCDECHFYMCTICFPLKQRIKHKSHPHLLRFVEDLPSDINCNAYDSICKSPLMPLPKELSFTQGYGFQCVECQFKIHLLCGPLPYTIKHESHVDYLTFEDSIVEDDDPDDEYYCNTCEELRDPRVCVYYCSECKFVAHVHCVMSKVVSLLKGEHGVVAIAGTTPMTVKEEYFEGPSMWEILHSLDKDEIEEINNCFEPQRWKNRKIVGTSIDDQNDGSNDIQEYFVKELIDRFCEMMSKVDLENEWGFKDFVNVEGYMLPQGLAPILKGLFAKYGDVSRESKLKHKAKWFLLSCLCWTVNKMCKTLVAEISKDPLAFWWGNLKSLQEAGFKVEFIVDRLTKVTRSYFRLEAKKRESEMSAKVEAMSRELEAKVEAMSRELEAMSRELKAVQQKVRSYYDTHNVMKWTFAGEGLL
ncbi:hypothetical protein CJ030_MR5G020286 [Morella rubra]|uniref:DC1 domain-containing protein n=1 Tax=Morella rubra TaxID=262757 RepID=A0A6A1VM06_9ROSI|nr:hypothetical protein CJ030_MR5G020304 [Morella rubra]KAB1213645.1 hypothetical protein CJ030_MR5G020286 [Morella rubra]